MTESILENTEAMAAVREVGFGFLVFDPSSCETADDEKIERMVIRMAEHLKEFGEDEDANWPELLCASLEFNARIVAAAYALQIAPRSAQTVLAEGMAKNLKDRILGALRREGAGQETKDN